MDVTIALAAPGLAGRNAGMLAEAEIGIAASTHAQWVEALSALLADREAVERLGAAAWSLAVSYYSVVALALRLAALFRRLV